MAMAKYSVKNISDSLVNDIKTAIQSVDKYGSVEIFIQNGIVTQITRRHIHKTTKETTRTNGHTKNGYTHK